MTVEEMAVRVQQVEDRSKSNSHRLNDVEKKLADNDQMLASIARLDQKQTDMDKDIKEIKSDVKTIAEKPGKRWDAVVDKVLLAIVAALVCYALSQIGLG